MIPVASERTVRLPVQWIGGAWQLTGGGQLPEISANACGELVLPAIFLVEEEQRRSWTQEVNLPLFSSGSKLFAQLDINRVPPAMREKGEHRPHKTGVPSLFVKIELQEALSLAYSCGKKGTLVGGRCSIPSLNLVADSVNEAYTRIVQAFTPKRRSFGGNVFVKVFADQGGSLVKLDVFRNRAISSLGTQAGGPRAQVSTALGETEGGQA